MITIDYQGTLVRFDDTGVDRKSPGLVHGALLGGRFYEQSFLRYIQSLGLSGCYLDVGAYIGTHTVFFGLICRASRVHAFEPRPQLAARIETNVQLNGLGDRVTVHQVALTDRPGDVSLTFRGVTHVVPGQRLDDLVRERVAVIKIDVEGMEPAVLRGASRMLRGSRPVVFVEAATEPEYEAVAAVMRQSDYVPTGRRFNPTPTYEFVHVSSPLAAIPLRRRLVDSRVGRQIKRVLPDSVRRRLRGWVPRSDPHRMWRQDQEK